MSTHVRVLKDDPFSNLEDGLQFRLTYQGLLLAENNRGAITNARADHKQMIRKAFHRQLKRLWSISPFLSLSEQPNSHKVGWPNVAKTSVPALANRFARNGYNFVPLITRDLNVSCEVSVLFLRNDPPGSVIKSGDIDNRLKTLFDALTMPSDGAQLGKFTTPDEDEIPFFCLLEDDCLITKASVESDTMLEPVNIDDPSNSARVIVTIRTGLLRVSSDNIGFL
ncbi:hypothetical protein U1839_07855 [Sphingomonas sp. RT2P30]|uniref:hypothetical protein n=1 Tax=Parasphingomonas halimpatiens TaxID=3096162 RepID=UPI002FC7C202